MDINFIFKIAAVGIIVAVLNTLLVRSGRDDQAMLTTLAGVVVVLMMLVPQIRELLPPLSIYLICNYDETHWYFVLRFALRHTYKKRE